MCAARLFVCIIPSYKRLEIIILIWIMFAECVDYYVNEAIDSYKFAPYLLKEL